MIYTFLMKLLYMLLRQKSHKACFIHKIQTYFYISYRYLLSRKKNNQTSREKKACSVCSKIVWSLIFFNNVTVRKVVVFKLQSYRSKFLSHNGLKLEHVNQFTNVFDENTIHKQIFLVYWVLSKWMCYKSINYFLLLRNNAMKAYRRKTVLQENFFAFFGYCA